MPASKTYIFCRIEGKVQQVGYRAWTRARAGSLGVRGWVRNEADGSVSACFAGAAQDVRALLEQCREGPPGAAVTGITERPASDADAGDDDFRIRY